MDYTKEEFKEIVNKFNMDKERYNWMYLINENIRNWERAKKKITNYPSYYNFISAREFRYWLLNSEKEKFIEERFCPVCGKFISVQEFGFQGHYKVACEEHSKEIRMKNVERGMVAKYGFKTPGKSKEVWDKIRKTNLEKYGVEYPLQNKRIHEKTINVGLEKGSYFIGAQRGKETKKQRYGDENYNNGKQISETKLNQPEEVKKEIREKLKITLKKRYGDENYNNLDQIKKTCLERYGVENPFSAEQFKEKIKENELKSRIRNHTTQKELIESTERRYPNDMTYKENYLFKMNEAKEKNGTTFTKLFNSDEVYKEGLTYKENFVKKCYETRKCNGTFNASKPEDQLYKSLVEAFVDVKRQYKSNLYPFACDYYIPKYDLYIENQGFPSHGKHPFDPSNPKDLEIVNRWKQKSNEINWKNKKKDLYKNFIEVWTEIDPLKREIAKKNNLNFIEIFPDDFNNDIDSIVEYIKKLTLQITENCIKCKMNLMEGNIMSKEITEEWRNEEIFGITKGHCLDLCLNTPFPGTEKWTADNPIWDCNVAGSISPKEGYRRPEYLVKAIDNLYWILNKSIDENRYEDFVRHQKERMNRSDVELVRVIVNRFTIAKICPKVTALMPSKFLQIIEDSGIDISCGVYCPMAGFGGIIEGAKRWFKEHSIDSADKIEAYDINPNFCKYYGWIQRDVLAQKVKTDKVVFVCPPFGLKTERWLGTPMERNDEFETNYLDFHDWCKLIREYIDAPNYIFVGPEESGRRPNKNISSGLFKKQFGVRWYPEYSNL